jgi:hypothetical protein
VPTAKSAVISQPNAHTQNPSRLRRVALIAIGVVAGLAVLLPAETLVASPVFAGASPNCPGWNSTTRPPDYIRVLRRQSGRVERVPFKKYVVTVLGKEWPGYLPQQVINAGAVAVKQYAWYHALGNGRVSKRGQCFDVTDGVGDQLYKPGKARIRQDHYTALTATWGVRLIKNGSLFMTGYRTGSKGACGYDATGWKLYARSATRCAYRGDGYQQILRIYYGPVSLSGSGNSSSSASSSALTFDQTVQPTDKPNPTDTTDTTEPTDTPVSQPADPVLPTYQGAACGALPGTDGADTPGSTDPAPAPADSAPPAGTVPPGAAPEYSMPAPMPAAEDIPLGEVSFSAT